MKIIGIDTDQSVSLYRTVNETNGDFGRKLLSLPVYLTPAKTWNFVTMVGLKNQNAAPTGPSTNVTICPFV